MPRRRRLRPRPTVEELRRQRRKRAADRSRRRHGRRPGDLLATVVNCPTCGEAIYLARPVRCDRCGRPLPPADTDPPAA